MLCGQAPSLWGFRWVLATTGSFLVLRALRFGTFFFSATLAFLTALGLRFFIQRENVGYGSPGCKEEKKKEKGPLRAEGRLPFVCIVTDPFVFTRTEPRRSGLVWKLATFTEFGKCLGEPRSATGDAPFFGGSGYFCFGDIIFSAQGAPQRAGVLDRFLDKLFGHLFFTSSRLG